MWTTGKTAQTTSKHHAGILAGAGLKPRTDAGSVTRTGSVPAPMALETHPSRYYLGTGALNVVRLHAEGTSMFHVKHVDQQGGSTMTVAELITALRQLHSDHVDVVIETLDERSELVHWDVSVNLGYDLDTPSVIVAILAPLEEEE